MSGGLFVQRFLVDADENDERPLGVRYDDVLGLTVCADGHPFVEIASPEATATDTRAFPSDRDLTTVAQAEVTNVVRDKARLPGRTEETAVRRDRPVVHASRVELWTRTGKGRDPGDGPVAALGIDTRVRRDRTASLRSEVRAR
jgi:hypothetical protein